MVISSKKDRNSHALAAPEDQLANPLSVPDESAVLANVLNQSRRSLRVLKSGYELGIFIDQAKQLVQSLRVRHGRLQTKNHHDTDGNILTAHLYIHSLLKRDHGDGRPVPLIRL